MTLLLPNNSLNLLIFSSCVQGFKAISTGIAMYIDVILYKETSSRYVLFSAV